MNTFDTESNLKNLKDIGAEVLRVARNLKEITYKLNKSDVIWDLFSRTYHF
jgi:hypothetical protein